MCVSREEQRTMLTMGKNVTGAFVTGTVVTLILAFPQEVETHSFMNTVVEHSPALKEPAQVTLD